METSTRLHGKVAIITGGSRGIGAEIARAYAAAGAKIVIASRKIGPLQETADTINATYPNAVFARACHTGHVEQVEDLVAWTASELGTPNVLVNNAATNPHFGPMLQCDFGAWNKTFDVNVKGPFEAIRQVSKLLVEQNIQGSIINVSSILGLNASPLQGVYGMTKAAVLSMTKTLSVELGGHGIRINAIAPGLVETKLSSVLVNTPDLIKQFHQRTPLKRHAQPHEISGLAVYLASDEASFVTGQTFTIDGGYSIS